MTEVINCDFKCLNKVNTKLSNYYLIAMFNVGQQSPKYSFGLTALSLNGDCSKGILKFINLDIQ